MMVYEISLMNVASSRTTILRVDGINCIDACKKARMAMSQQRNWTILSSKLVSVRY